MSLKLSLCITTYNRPELTIEAFEKVYNDPRIDEIVIVDDCSDMENMGALCSKVSLLPQLNDNAYGKIKIHRNAENIGMSRNKAKALEYATNDWCILFDSDNVLDVDYLDAFYKEFEYATSLGMNPNHFIFCPDFAKPDFNYTKYAGTLYNKANVASYINYDDFNCLMNTCNYIVHRPTYLKSYIYNPDHIASDTIWHNYNHLIAGGGFIVVSNMQYFHRVHKESGFMQNVDYNIKQAEKVRKLISELCS